MADRAYRKYSALAMVQKLTVKAVLEMGLIEDGDRILIAVSGGKDSTILAVTLSRIRAALKKQYDLKAVHISTDFCSCCKKSVLSERLEKEGVPFDDVFVPVIGRLKEGRKMNCYWCSTQRRLELIRYAQENGFNVIALGHHLDDVIETFFMNMIFKGELCAMPALLRYRKYPLKLIRPLVYVEESRIVEAAAEYGFLKAACSCPYGRFSRRRVIRKKIDLFLDGSSPAKRRVLASLTGRNFDLLKE
ncbi:MAG: tRNA 2-thiocytidine biosynthesis TtcA family protein [Spirochaetaceae bacterium]|jgi:tRNA 2-thiocytidine biosynthesis protein TtcA|nr:tRNA 2-thiocytidine biosynthesis TtcA family protein [Spirochaetaceae bacterium]